MTVSMPSTATTTQTFTILTDVQVANPSIICPITASNLIPAAAYISLTGATISVDASQIVSPADYGTNGFTITVDSANFSGSVTS